MPLFGTTANSKGREMRNTGCHFIVMLSWLAFGAVLRAVRVMWSKLAFILDLLAMPRTFLCHITTIKCFSPINR